MNPNENRNVNKIMTVQDVSTFLKIPVSTIYILAKQGKLKGAKFGRHWRFLEQDIVDYLHGKGSAYAA